MAKSKLKFEITKHLGVICEGKKGWKKEINMVSWNERPAKIDIRDWDENHEKMGKGLTLTVEEFIDLKETLEEIDIEDLN